MKSCIHYCNYCIYYYNFTSPYKHLFYEIMNVLLEVDAQKVRTY